ncbi:tubulin beta chain [Hydra vulgaris]|uniref:tubulin beta chain n=1 Tax=Hydra vulgaris TaxID=6087 RepID=UPI0001927946|nr:tubulin beta chain [Hydra vulgaris]
MQEIVSLQYGQCGNQIGTKFWETICEEHNINKDGLLDDLNNGDNGKIGVCFHENNNGINKKYVPRTVLVDLEPGVIDAVKSGISKGLYRPDNFVAGNDGAGNNWAKGYLVCGNEYIERVLDIIRKEVEACNCIQAFHMMHSLGGGTGSGFGSLTLNRLREEYPDILFINTSIFPSALVSEVIVEPYNTVLSLDLLLEQSDGVFCMDNEALSKICLNKLKQKRVTYDKLNQLVAAAMSGVTTSLRFPGQLNADIRKLSVNMIPFPRLHFYMTGLSPLLNADEFGYCKQGVAELTRDLFEPSNMMVDCNPRAGRYLTFAAMYRGAVSMRDIDEQLKLIQNKNSAYFVEWIPNNAKVSSCNVAPKGHKLTATFLANNTSLQDVMRRIRDQYLKMFKRKAFLHWYTTEGIEEMQFTEAESNINDIISEYEQLTHMTANDLCCCSDLEDSLEELDSGISCL